MEQKINVIESKTLSSNYEKRYIIVDIETDKVLDDAQGYGYKSVRNAYAAWAYKNRDKSKDEERKAKKKHIQQWLKEHNDFTSQLEGIEWDIVKGCAGKVDTKLIKKLLKENNLEPDFTARDLLKVWRS